MRIVQSVLNAVVKLDTPISVETVTGKDFNADTAMVMVNEVGERVAVTFEDSTAAYDEISEEYGRYPVTEPIVFSIENRFRAVVSQESHADLPFATLIFAMDVANKVLLSRGVDSLLRD